MSADVVPGVSTTAAPPWPWRLASAVALVLALAALCFVVAYWFWRVAAPAPIAPAPIVVPSSAAVQIAAAAPFGADSVAPAAAGPVVTAAALPSDVRLLGVLAAAEGRGQALFRVPELGAVLVRVGGEITRDVVLVAVQPDRVRVRDRGEMRELLLRPASAAALIAPLPAGKGTGSGGDRSACAAPPGFKGNVYRINAELLSGMAAQPDSWKPLLTASSAGLRVTGGGGFAALLNLKSGDSLREANGIRLTAADDLIVAVVKPLQGNQPVRVKASRDGSELELLLVNASACGGSPGPR